MTTRSFTRVPVHIRALIEPVGYEPAEGVVRDLSLNGVSVACQTLATPGTSCGVTLLLSTGAQPIPIRAHGTVARRDLQVVAIRIDGVDPDDFQHFSNLVLYNAPDPNTFEEEVETRVEEQPALRPTED